MAPAKEYGPPTTFSNGGANTHLTAANSWYFPDDGIEFTAVGGVAARIGRRSHSISAMGDIFGFANTTLTSSPAQGAATVLRQRGQR